MIPKNGCSSYGTFLADAGWVRTDLFSDSLDLDNTIFFGHITDPNVRHTKGLAQYLLNSDQIDLLSSPLAKVLVSGVFDHHCYSINMMIPHLINRVHWIPLDYKWRHFDGDFLTNRFFKQNQLDLHYSGKGRINVADERKNSMYAQIQTLKDQYSVAYQDIVKNFLDIDIKFHTNAIDYYNHINLDDN